MSQNLQALDDIREKEAAKLLANHELSKGAKQE
jgi:hypothetical protein